MCWAALDGAGSGDVGCYRDRAVPCRVGVGEPGRALPGRGGFAALDDKVYGVLLETALQRVRLVALKNRGIAGETEISLPAEWNADKVNVYCFATSGNERMVSDSVFLPVSPQV